LPGLEILLFTADVPLARLAATAGLPGVVVDWEDRRHSVDRSQADGGGGPDTIDDLRRVAAVSSAKVVCRINAVGERTECEVERALEAGATDVLVPMIETADQIERVVELVDGCAGVGIMIETVAACECASDLAKVPVDFVYVGLLDLAIDRGEGNVFRALADGTAAQLRECFAETRFGIGGVTVVDAGSPVPCHTLMQELARLRTDIVFARRSLKRDLVGRDLTVEHRRLHAAWQELLRRDNGRVDADHHDFVARFGGSRPSR
jgi:hypothetical protein